MDPGAGVARASGELCFAFCLIAEWAVWARLPLSASRGTKAKAAPALVILPAETRL
jgi:hypothetical protein